MKCLLLIPALLAFANPAAARELPRAGGEAEDQQRAGEAGEAGGDDRHVELLERTRHVDPLAACQRQDVARAVALAQLERRDGQRAVERGVEGDGDDHGESRRVRRRAPRDCELRGG